MMESIQLGIGQIIATEQQKDAIHIAIAPMTATEIVHPGQHVNAMGGTAAPHVGIVDPYLKARVFPNERYWLFLYPNTVTGLRHEWTHPAFSGGPVNPGAEPWESRQKESSMAWMEEFASHHSEPYKSGEPTCTAEQLIEAGKEFLLNGDKMIQQGSESLRDDTRAEEFWRHFEAITGMKVPNYHRNETPFCCTC